MTRRAVPRLFRRSGLGARPRPDSAIRSRSAPDARPLQAPASVTVPAPAARLRPPNVCPLAALRGRAVVRADGGRPVTPRRSMQVGRGGAECAELGSQVRRASGGTRAGGAAEGALQALRPNVPGCDRSEAAPVGGRSTGAGADGGRPAATARGPALAGVTCRTGVCDSESWDSGMAGADLSAHGGLRLPPESSARPVGPGPARSRIRREEPSVAGRCPGVFLPCPSA